jgi:hypothetical protein
MLVGGPLVGKVGSFHNVMYAWQLPGMISGKVDVRLCRAQGPRRAAGSARRISRRAEGAGKAGSGARRTGRGDLPVRVIATGLSLGFVLDAVVIRTLLVPVLVAIM